MNGVLVVDKPPGPTSHDIVARVRRAIHVRRIGHTGTLDPLATGVLPLVVGRATRLASLLSGAEKEYEADVRFGSATDTYDADPRTIQHPESGTPLLTPPPAAPSDLTRASIEAALQDFRGTFWQVPPPFSAKKLAGVPAYERARRHEPVALEPVSVTVRHLTLQEYSSGLARLQVTSSAGFYVRSLAHDLGVKLGCGAHLERLRRLRSGDFTLADAVTLDVVEAEGPDSSRRLVPLHRLLPGMPAVVLTEQGALRASHGNTLNPGDFVDPAANDGRQVRLLDGSGALVGIGERVGTGLLHPAIVLV